MGPDAFDVGQKITRRTLYKLHDRVTNVDHGYIVAIDPAAALKKCSVETSPRSSRRPVGLLVDQFDDRPWIRECTVVDNNLYVTVDDSDVRIVDLAELTDEVDLQLYSIDRRKPNLESAFLSVTDRTIDGRKSVSSIGETGSDDRLKFDGGRAGDRSSLVLAAEDE